MEKTYFFPSFCKKAGLGMFVPFAVAGVCMLGGWWNLEWSLPVFALAADPLGASGGSFVTVRADVFPTLVIFGLVVSLLMICFSREKDEDEYVVQLRCRTLVVSVMASYVPCWWATCLSTGYRFSPFCLSICSRCWWCMPCCFTTACTVPEGVPAMKNELKCCGHRGR